MVKFRYVKCKRCEAEIRNPNFISCCKEHFDILKGGLICAKCKVYLHLNRTIEQINLTWLQDQYGVMILNDGLGDAAKKELKERWINTYKSPLGKITEMHETESGLTATLELNEEGKRYFNGTVTSPRGSTRDDSVTGRSYGAASVVGSHVGLKYYIEKDLIGDIYVITTAKKRDTLEWERRRG